MNLGDTVADFEADSTAGKLKLYDHLGNGWGLVFVIPKGFSAVGTTELAELARHAGDFTKRNTRIVVVSSDSIANHQAWLKDVTAFDAAVKEVPFPVVADESKGIVSGLKVADAAEATGAALLVSPEKKLKLVLLYPDTTGRNVHEILRALDSIQLTQSKSLATPAKWKYGGHNCILHKHVSEDDASKLFPHPVSTIDLPSGKNMQITADPRMERVLLPSWLVPEEYDMTLHPNVDPSSTYRFEGTQTLTCTITASNQTKIHLHSKELSILTATYEAEGYSAEAIGFEYDLDESTVAISFKDPLPVGRGALKTDFIGTHNNQMAGFYRSGYTDAEKRPKVMVSTQFEALDARRCFPCVDEPNVKAVFKAALVVDVNLTALSNMPESETTLLPGGKKKKIVFMPSPKMSTYLLAFAVGEFDFLSKVTEHGVLIRVFTPPTKSAQGKFALDVACKSLDFYDDFFGVPYPLPKLDMIAIPEFAMGAMENWGLVTYREVEVLIAEGASADQKQRVCTVITHELAHQWYGNLVTFQWWDNLWLNEGFASFMQTLSADVIFPEWQMWTNFVIEDQAAALSADALTSSHPIQVPIRRAEEVEEVFDAISYHKGACVVQLIRAYLGADVFRSGVQLYMQRHAYGNTETHDLWKAWEDSCGGSKPVSKVMASWTEQMGFPVLYVSKFRTEGTKFKFKVRQAWFLADGSRPKGWETKFWTIPLLAAYQSLGTNEVSVVGVEVGLYESRDEREFEIETSQEISAKKTWVKLNAGQSVPMRVLYEDQADVENLAAAVREKALNSEDRAGLLLDAYALAKAGLQSPGQVLILLQAYDNEDNMAVWDAIEQVLSGLSTLLRSDGELNAKFVQFAAKLIKKQADRLGWEERAGEGHLDNLSRSILVRLQCKFAPEQVKDKTNALFQAYLKAPTDPTALDSNIKTPVLRVALATHGKAEMEALKKTLDVLDTVAEKKDVYAALGFTPAIEDKTAVLDWCTSGAVKLQDFFYPMASVSGSGAGGAELAFEYMKKHFDRIFNMIKKGSPSLIMAVISYCCAGFASVKRAEEIEAFFKENPVPLASRRVAQIIESTKANAAFLERIRNDKLFNDMVVS